MSYFANEQIANCDAHTTDDDWYDRKDYTRPGIFAAMESQRSAAQYNTRPVVSGKARAQQLVLCIEVAKRDGRMAEARAFAMQLRPLLHLLDEVA